MSESFLGRGGMLHGEYKRDLMQYSRYNGIHIFKNKKPANAGLSDKAETVTE